MLQASPPLRQAIYRLSSSPPPSPTSASSDRPPRLNLHQTPCSKPAPSQPRHLTKNDLSDAKRTSLAASPQFVALAHAFPCQLPNTSSHVLSLTHLHAKSLPPTQTMASGASLTPTRRPCPRLKKSLRTGGRGHMLSCPTRVLKIYMLCTGCV